MAAKYSDFPTDSKERNPASASNPANWLIMHQTRLDFVFKNTSSLPKRHPSSTLPATAPHGIKTQEDSDTPLVYDSIALNRCGTGEKYSSIVTQAITVKTSQELYYVTSYLGM